MSEIKPLTLRETIGRLLVFAENYPDALDKPVVLEGCDCVAACGDVHAQDGGAYMRRVDILQSEENEREWSGGCSE